MAKMNGSWKSFISGLCSSHSRNLSWLSVIASGHKSFLLSLLHSFFIFKFICFWLRWVFVAARRLFSSCGERGLLFHVVHGLLIVVASLVAEHGL